MRYPRCFTDHKLLARHIDSVKTINCAISWVPSTALLRDAGLARGAGRAWPLSRSPEPCRTFRGTATHREFRMISQMAANRRSAKPHVLAATGSVLEVLALKQLTTGSSGLSAKCFA